MSAHLATYLNDHLGGATTGLEMFRRAARTQGSPDLARLRDEVQQDRDSLVRLMRAVGVRVRSYKVLGGWALEKAARFKPNGHLLTRSPLSDLVELEALHLGVVGKAGLWRALLEVPDDRLDRSDLQGLVSRAEGQAQALERLRLDAARAVLGED